MMISARVFGVYAAGPPAKKGEARNDSARESPAMVMKCLDLVLTYNEGSADRRPGPLISFP